VLLGRAWQGFPTILAGFQAGAESFSARSARWTDLYRTALRFAWALQCCRVEGVCLAGSTYLS
jgi:hypothetical protein